MVVEHQNLKRWLDLAEQALNCSASLARTREANHDRGNSRHAQQITVQVAGLAYDGWVPTPST